MPEEMLLTGVAETPLCLLGAALIICPSQHELAKGKGRVHENKACVPCLITCPDARAHPHCFLHSWSPATSKTVGKSLVGTQVSVTSCDTRVGPKRRRLRTNWKAVWCFLDHMARQVLAQRWVLRLSDDTETDELSRPGNVCNEEVEHVGYVALSDDLWSAWKMLHVLTLQNWSMFLISQRVQALHRKQGGALPTIAVTDTGDSNFPGSRKVEEDLSQLAASAVCSHH